MLTIGVLKDTKIAERRVTLVPEDAARLRSAGAAVLVQSTAGAGAGFSDDDFRESGAQIAASAPALIAASDVVVKVKEPVRSEIEWLRPDQLFLSFLHLAAFPELVEPLLRSGVTAIGYETIGEGGQHPVLQPMSEVAGALSLQIGEHYLQATEGGRGILFPGIHGEHAGKVVIVGSGVVGEACGRLAYGEGIHVVFVDSNPERLAVLARRYPLASSIAPSANLLAAALEDADLLVGAVYVTGARAPRVVSREQIARMPAGSVALDVAIDQGGCLATARPTTHEDPVYLAEGVLHYCVQNIPTMVPRTASIALSRALVPYLEAIARQDIDGAFGAEPGLVAGVNVSRGEVVLPALQFPPAGAAAAD